MSKNMMNGKNYELVASGLKAQPTPLSYCRVGGVSVSLSGKNFRDRDSRMGNHLEMETFKEKIPVVQET